MNESVSPRQCVLALGVPLTEQQFYADLDCPRKDYAKSIARSNEGAEAVYLWEIYRPVAILLEAVSTEVCSLGSVAERGVGLMQFHNLLSRYRVVTLVAHCCADGVELADGLHRADELVELVPVDYNGVLDLSLCSSAAVGEAIKQRSPRSTVIRNSGEATPRFKLTRYKHIMRRLARKEQPYLDALFDFHHDALEVLYP